MAKPDWSKELYQAIQEQFGLPAPLIFIVLLVLFSFMAHEGITRGMLYAGIDPDSPEELIIHDIFNKNKRKILPDYVATGFIRSTMQDIEVEVFKSDYEYLDKYSVINVYKVPGTIDHYIYEKKYDEALPLVNLGLVTVTWHFIVGFPAILFLLFLLLAGQKPRIDMDFE